MSMLVGARRVLGTMANRALDLALPGSCAGCGEEGTPLCRECRPDLDVRPLQRTRVTAAQFDLDRAARATNLVAAFCVRDAAAAAAVRDRWLVLVDDVVTTGATLAACASALLEAGALAVSAVAVARER